MKLKSIFCGIGIYLCLQFTIVFTQNTTNIQEKEDEYVPYGEARYDKFDWNLVKESLESPSTGNTIISPVSVKLVLAMLYEASSRETETELQFVLDLPVTRHATRDRFRQILRSFNTYNDNQKLDFGSCIFINNTIVPQERYTDILKRYYKADMVSVNFEKKSETAVKINNWANHVTRGHVKELVSENSLNDAVVLLANAMYFKGAWRKEFDVARTMPSNFYTSEQTVIKDVPYMVNYDSFYYSNYPKLDVEFLRLPFKGNVSMFIILPKKHDGLSTFIKNITPKDMQDLRWSLNKRDLFIYIPKFAFSYNSKMKEYLIALGLRGIFQNIANLPLLSLKNVAVKDIIQKAGIQIDEKGGSAWAATESVLVNKFGSKDPIFNASHPFLFYLEDESTGNVLFVGKVENPLQSDIDDVLEQILQGKINPFQQQGKLNSFRKS